MRCAARTRRSRSTPRLRRGSARGGLVGARRRRPRPRRACALRRACRAAAGGAAARHDARPGRGARRAHARGLPHLRALRTCSPPRVRTSRCCSRSRCRCSPGPGVGLRGRLLGALALIALYVPLAGGGPVDPARRRDGRRDDRRRARRPTGVALVRAAARRGRRRSRVNPRASARPRLAAQLRRRRRDRAARAGVRGALRARRAPGRSPTRSPSSLAATLGTAPLIAFHFSPARRSSRCRPTCSPHPRSRRSCGSACSQPRSARSRPALALPLNALNAYLLAYVGWVAHAAAGLPHASIPLALQRRASRSAPPTPRSPRSRCAARAAAPRAHLDSAPVPTFKPAYLIHGDDHGRIAERRARLRALAEAESGAQGIELFEGETASAEAVAAALSAMTFAIGRRFLIVDGVERWKAADVELIAPALASLAPETTVVFFGREEGRTKVPDGLAEAVQQGRRGRQRASRPSSRGSCRSGPIGAGRAARPRAASGRGAARSSRTSASASSGCCASWRSSRSSWRRPRAPVGSTSSRSSS